jgi:hypothetical protein
MHQIKNISSVMETASKQSTVKLVQYTLGSLLFLLAVNAFGGGYYALAGAKDIPIEWLEGSPFSDYFIPGLFLFLIIGGSALLAGIAVFSRRRLARKAAFFCGIIVLLWITMQVSIIGYVSWMQPATTIAAIAILILAWQLPKYEHLINLTDLSCKATS